MEKFNRDINCLRQLLVNALLTLRLSLRDIYIQIAYCIYSGNISKPKEPHFWQNQIFEIHIPIWGGGRQRLFGYRVRARGGGRARAQETKQRRSRSAQLSRPLCLLDPWGEKCGGAFLTHRARVSWCVDLHLLLLPP
jgi:hypothetical protein